MSKLPNMVVGFSLTEVPKMTPFGTRLKDKIDAEVLHMQNEWFSKWHFIKEQKGVEIDSFDGRKISYGGIQYWGSAHSVYWATLHRYLSLRLGEYFDSTVEAVERFPRSMATDIINEFDFLLKGFCSTIATIAAEKDRILRGNGTEFPDIDTARRSELVRKFGVLDKTLALKALLEAQEKSEKNSVSSNATSVQVVFLNDVDALRDLKVSLDELISRLTSSNSIGEENPDQKKQHLAELKAAKELLNAPQVEKQSFGLLISRALKWVSEKAAGTAITETVKAVVVAIFKNGL